MLFRWSAKQKKPNKMTQTTINTKDVMICYNFMYCADLLKTKETYTIIKFILNYFKTAPPHAKAEYAPSISACVNLLKTLHKNKDNSDEFMSALVANTKWVVVLTAWFIAQCCDVEGIMSDADDNRHSTSDRQYLHVCNACKTIYQLRNIEGVEDLDNYVKIVSIY